MELWVRSQNKKKLYKCDELDLEKEVFKDWCIETKVGQDYVVKDSWCIYINNKLFGRYFDEEKALEILDEIQERIINLQLVSLEERGKARQDVYTCSYLECVYQMPKE